jgi:hypothetical protein
MGFATIQNDHADTTKPEMDGNAKRDMTATELQRLVRIISNQAWCRHWLNYGDRSDNVVMAIQCRDATGKPEPIDGLSRLGFTELQDHTYTIPRTNEDGSPFASKLF